jgi:hypothetical protein
MAEIREIVRHLQRGDGDPPKTWMRWRCILSRAVSNSFASDRVRQKKRPEKRSLVVD